MTQLEGSRVLVVGATGALGRLIADRLADGGVRLALHGRDVDRLAALDALGATIDVELTDEDAPERIIAAALDALGGLDGVVLAAGAVAFDTVPETAGHDLETLFTVNALAPIRIMSTAVPALRESAAAGRDPFVLGLSGIVAEMPTVGLPSYSASKAALAAYLTAAGRELRRSGIRVLDAHVGHTETGLSERALFGRAPRFPPGHDPTAVADRLVRAVRDGETALPPAAFAVDRPDGAA
jgi:cyclic-di-GMP-binding biofilm dispersal mediator protein